MSVSSLLKSAVATQAKIQAAQDAQVAYEWQNSAMTYEDYKAYEAYLKDSQAKSQDPTTQLSYDNKLRTAYRSYTSNEIQRQSQAIMEGGSNTQNKMAVVETLYNQAVANGDMNLAQNLVSTWDTLSVKLQNEAISAASGGGGSGSAAAATAFKAQVTDAIQSYSDLKDSMVAAIVQSGNPTEAAQNIASINAQLPPEQQIPTDAGIFDVAAAYVDSVNALYAQAGQVAPDATTLDDINKQANKFNTSTVLTLPSPSGENISLKPQDIQKQIALSNVGQSMFSETNTANGKAFVKNKVDNYEFGHDVNGNIVAIPTYSKQGMDLSSTVTDLEGNPINTVDAKGKKGKQATYQDLLKSAGFNVSESGGSLLVQDTTGQNRLNGSDSAQVYLTQDGKLQFVGTPQSQGNGQFQDNPIYELGFDKDGKFSGVSQSVANPFLQQYTSDYRGGDTPYFQTHPNEAAGVIGTAGMLTPQTVGQFDASVIGNKNPILSGAGFSSSAPRFSSATNVLQNAATTQGNIARAQAFQAPAVPQIGAAPMPQIQAPSIGQALLSNRAASITVAKPTAPAANISTKPLAGNVKNVTVQKTAPKLPTISF